MRCKQEEILSRFIDNDLSSAEEAEFYRHMEICPECRISYHETISREKALREVVEKALPIGTLSEKVMRQINKDMPKLYPKRTFWLNRLSWSIPVLIPALIITLFVILNFTQKIKININLSNAPHQTSTFDDDHTQSKSPTLPGWLPVSAETISVVALSPDSWINNKPLEIGKVKHISPHKQIEARGSLEFSLNPSASNRVIFEGNGIFSISCDVINWIKGKSEFTFSLTSPVSIQIGEIGLRIVGTKIRLEGDINNEVRLEVLTGKVFLNSKEISGYLAIGKVVSISNNKIENLADIFSKKSEIHYNENNKSSKYGYLKDPDRESSIKFSFEDK